jgi:hypothetical protein
MGGLGKRSDFKRIKKDAYQTIDRRAVPPLIPHLHGIRSYAEPCAGEGKLIEMMDEFAPHIQCGFANDIDWFDGEDAIESVALAAARDRYDAIIVNPPWTRKLLHPMITSFMSLAPTYLLFDAGWAFTKQAAPFLPYCTKIITIGRLKWIPDTTMSSKDDCAWFVFNKDHDGGPRFYGKT